MLHPTPEQAEFIRAHGITRCPQGPQFDMPWHKRASVRATERELLASFGQLSPIPDLLPNPEQRERRRLRAKFRRGMPSKTLQRGSF
jgi:hypothetical protein